MATDYLIQGLLVPAGTSRIELRYRPTSVLVGALVSGTTTALLAIAIGAGLFRRHRRPLLRDKGNRRKPGPGGNYASRSRQNASRCASRGQACDFLPRPGLRGSAIWSSFAGRCDIDPRLEDRSAGGSAIGLCMPPEPAKKPTLPQFVAKLEPTNFPSREGGNSRAHTARRCAKFARDEVRPRKVTALQGCPSVRP
jgi:hypothetical protein